MKPSMTPLKYFTFIIFLFTASTSFGQTIDDALRFSQQHYEGTARSLAMGNAFTAVGGDLGAIPINPAASGIFRYSEFVLTPSLNTSVNHTTYLGNKNSDNRTRFGLSNVGWVGHFDTGRTRGLLNINVALTANQTNNFNSSVSAHGREASSSWAGSLAAHTNGIPGYAFNPDKNGNIYFDDYDPSLWNSVLGWNTYLIDTTTSKGDAYYLAATEKLDANDNPYIAGELDQEYSKITTGYTSDISINVGGNISDKLFFGVNLTFQSINYRSTESFSESAVDPNNFDKGFNSFTHTRTIAANGVSVGLKAGIIYLPVAGLRIGAAISTPTWMHLTHKWEEEMNTSFNEEHGKTSLRSVLGMYDYRVTSPFKWNVGVAYTFGKIGLISFDYENTNYSKMTMADSDGNKRGFNNDNSLIGQYYKTVHNFRAGLEARITPNISLRAGYNFFDSPDRDFDLQKHFASIGIGYKTDGGFFVDLAYQQQINYSEEASLLYAPYEDYDYTNDSAINVGIPIMDRKYLNWKLLLSIGFRF